MSGAATRGVSSWTLRSKRSPASSGTDKGVLKLDLRYLARIGVPLFRITHQRNGVSALGDLVTFLGYVVAAAARPAHLELPRPR